MVNYSTQINNKEYNDLDYLDKPRWISLWHQINEVVNTKPKNVLEIGVGNGVVTYTLKQLGINVKTADLDRRLKPDYVTDILRLPLKKNSFDTILCAQVLEHIRFSDVSKALTQMCKVARKYVIITLPHDYLTYFLLSFKIIPFVKIRTWFITIPRWQAHEFNGQHYWEIGKKNFPTEKISKLINKSGFNLLKHYRLSENPYHHFFILKKIKYD